MSFDGARTHGNWSPMDPAGLDWTNTQAHLSAQYNVLLRLLRYGGPMGR